MILLSPKSGSGGGLELGDVIIITWQGNNEGHGSLFVGSHIVFDNITFDRVITSAGVTVNIFAAEGMNLHVMNGDTETVVEATYDEYYEENTYKYTVPVDTAEDTNLYMAIE